MRTTLGLLALLSLLTSPLLGSEAESLKSVDLSGDWYVLIHYKDSKSQNPSITKFKDFAWSIQQSADRIEWEHYPYVIFGEELELARRHAMTEHLAWEPDDATWQKIRKSIRVSSRAKTKKKLRGGIEAGYESGSTGGGGLNTLTFSRHWSVGFQDAKITVKVVDSLSGGEGLASMEEATVYEIVERKSSDELRGTWREGSRKGQLRMVRSQNRRVK